MDHMNDFTALRVIQLHQQELEARAEKERTARGLHNRAAKRLRAFISRETQR